MPATIAAISANPPMTPPTIGPAGVKLLDCEVGVGVGVRVVGVTDFERVVVIGVDDGVDVVELKLTGVFDVDGCVDPSGFVSVRPSCPE